MFHISFPILAASGASLFWQAPPLHPILVHFTAALVPVSLLSDLSGAFLREASLRSVGRWTLLFASALTPFTVAAGWWWLRGMGESPHQEMVIHQWLGTALAVLLIPLAVWRERLHQQSGSPSLVYMGVVTMFVLALSVQGHLGGMMSLGDSRPPTANVVTDSRPVSEHDWHDAVDAP